MQNVHIFGLLKVHTFEPSISLISLILIMQNPDCLKAKSQKVVGLFSHYLNSRLTSYGLFCCEQAPTHLDTL